jgi:hypothetical protein
MGVEAYLRTKYEPFAREDDERIMPIEFVSEELLLPSLNRARVIFREFSGVKRCPEYISFEDFIGVILYGIEQGE